MQLNKVRRGWMLVTAVAAATVTGCSGSSPQLQTPNDFILTLSASGVRCDAPSIGDPKRPSELVFNPDQKPTDLNADASELYDQLANSTATYQDITCSTGQSGTSKYMVVIAPQDVLDQECEYRRTLLSDQKIWGAMPEEQRQQLRDNVASEVATGEGWWASKYDNAWPSLAQPADVARALGGSVKTNMCDIELPE